MNEFKIGDEILYNTMFPGNTLGNQEGVILDLSFGIPKRYLIKLHHVKNVRGTCVETWAEQSSLKLNIAKIRNDKLNKLLSDE